MGLAASEAALLGPGARRLVGRVLSRSGDTVRTMETRQVLRRPGRRTLVRWQVTSGRSGPTQVVGIASADPMPDGVVVLEAGGVRVGIFLVPDDPLLPGMAPLSTPRGASEVLGEEVVRVRRRRYRPLGRAVVEVTTADGSTRWAKVVRPTRTDRLVEVHQRCAPVVGGPAVHLVRRELGIVVLDHVEGVDLRSRLRREGSPLPAPASVLAVPARLAEVDSPLAVRRRPPLASVRSSVRRLRDVLPSEHQRVSDIASRLPPPTRTSLPGPTVHGDLHSAQLMVAGTRVSGLVDLDDAGAGDPVDDVARFLAHLLCTTDHRDGRWARDWTRQWHAAAAAEVSAERLQPRVAAALLSLALGPHRLHREGWEERSRRRLAMAEHWAREDEVGGPWP